MKNSKKIILIAFIIATGFKLHASNDDSTIVRPVHVSFVTPLGTNGMESMEVTNIFSLNIMAGASGGLMGCEIGGFANYLHGDMTGVQIAGFGNTTMGYATGAEISGFYNYNRRMIIGTQISGFANVVTDSIVGAQIAGFSNVTTSSIEGIQISGFSNYAKSVSYGQISGFANVCLEDLSGIQISGFSNITRGKVSGSQIAGFSNVASGVSMGQISGFSNVNHGDMYGPQISGFINVNHGDALGAQISGFANVNTGEITGGQISGFFNVAKKVNGSQIGIINIADSIENGISLGVLSFVKNGYRAFEISGNESLFGVASFKTGTEKFYNILSLGASVKDNMFLWGYGYGIGTLFSVSEKVDLNIDAVAYHISNDFWFSNQLNMLNKLNITATYKLSETIAVFGGVTWNVVVSNVTDNEGNPDTPIVPWNVYNKTKYNTNVKMYPGFTFGIKL